MGLGNSSIGEIVGSDGERMQPISEDLSSNTPGSSGNNVLVIGRGSGYTVDKFDQDSGAQNIYLSTHRSQVSECGPETREESH